MKRKEYKFGKDARDSILRVATHINDVLGKTLGPAGRDYQTPQGITNDGKSILEEIRFQDECEDNVALAYHEVARRIDAEVGDGTTTGVTFATALTIDLIPQIPDLDTPVAGQKSVMEISRELEVEKGKAIELLSKETIPVTTLEQLEKVAFTSMEDKEVAKIVAKTIFDAGKDSHTALDEGFSNKVETSIQAGIEIPVKLNNPGTHIEAVESPVLVVNHIFESYRELTPFMQTLAAYMNQSKMKFNNIVIVAKKFSIPFMQEMAYVNQKGTIQFICLSNDHLDDSLFEDVAAFCDAKYVDTHPKGGKSILDTKFEYCGLASKVIVTPKGAVFYGGKGTALSQDKEPTTRVQARVLQLRALLNEEKDPKKRAIMERRIAEFQAGKATIYVDAKTSAEKYYLKLKVQDCMNSCKTALEGGMVRGGGLSLRKVADALGTDSILYGALMAPYNRIQLNAGGVLEIGDDVFDSYLVAKSGIENAISVIKTAIRIEGIIADNPKSLVDDLQTALTAA